MTDLLIRPVSDIPQRNIYAADSPIDFASWLTVAENLDTELIQGVMVNRMAAHYPHESIFMWLASILRSYTRHLGLGIVLGSRTAVKINAYNGRLPDLLFVRADNTAIIHDDAIYGIPDLIIEIVSPNDRPSDLIPLETNYRMLGVPEIVFVNPQKQHLRIVTSTDTGYEDRLLTSGLWESATVAGFHIEVAWLFAEPQPDELTTVLQLIREREAGL